VVSPIAVECQTFQQTANCQKNRNQEKKKSHEQGLGQCISGLVGVVEEDVLRTSQLARESVEKERFPRRDPQTQSHDRMCAQLSPRLLVTWLV